MAMKQKKRRIFIRLAAFVAVVLFGAEAVLPLCSPLPAYAADNTASAMRIEKTEGTVRVSNAAGRALTLRKEMRLYNGYGVGTEEESYAWLNLDQSKLLLLDAFSEASVRKREKKLEVLLESGNLFFDIARPLENDESLSIRTSTMTIGIRGTSGWVEKIDPNRARISVLEGRVQVSATDPRTGQTKTDYINGGETAVCIVYNTSSAGGQSAVRSSGISMR